MLNRSIISNPEYAIEQDKIIAIYTIISKDINIEKHNKINQLNIICSQEIEKGKLCFNNNFYRFNKDEDQINYTQQLLEIIDDTASGNNIMEN